MRITFAFLDFHIALNTYTKTHKTETNRSRHTRPFLVLHKQAKELDDFGGGSFRFNRTRSLWPISGDSQASLALPTSQGVPWWGDSLPSTSADHSPLVLTARRDSCKYQARVSENPIVYKHQRNQTQADLNSDCAMFQRHGMKHRQQTNTTSTCSFQET